MVAPDADIREAARMMVSQRIHHVLVVDNEKGAASAASHI